MSMQVAQPSEREVMAPRAIEILDKVAFEIAPHRDPALARLLAEVRSQVEMSRG